MTEKAVCSEIFWKIENFSFWWPQENETLQSPTFWIEQLFGSSLSLWLAPNGEKMVDIGVFVMQKGSSEKEIPVGFEFTIMDKNNLPRNTVMLNDTFNGNVFVSPLFFTRLLSSEKKDIYFPHDDLTIRCRIWKRVENPPGTTRCFLCTHIPVIQHVFLWHVKNVSDVSHKDSISFKVPLEETKFLLVELIYACEEEEKFIQIEIRGKINRKCSWKCDIRDSESEDCFLQCRDKFSSVPYKRKFIPFLPSENVAEESVKYASDSTLVLKCSFCLWYDLKYLHEMVSVGNSVGINPFHSNSVNVYEHAETVNCEYKNNDSDHSLQEDIRNIYWKELLCDFNIEVQGETFPVHSTILAARSPEFSRMIESDLKEKNIKSLVLNDLEVDIVHRMIEYIYTDDPGVLCWSSAFELYRVGVRFEILGLKAKASSFLEKNVACNNVLEALEFADENSDPHLKSALMKFILSHEKEVIVSEKLEVLSKKNSRLVAETFINIGKLKFK